MGKSLTEILDAVATETDDVLAANPPVRDVAPGDLDADNLPDAGSKTWFRLEEVVAVFADLKSSTRMGIGKHAASTAAIYRAATGNVVKILHELGADFIQIQGDGVFGLFWGELAAERAVCAGITIKTFSEKVLQTKLESKWREAPPTGFKVGIAAGKVLVKRVGTPRNANEQEPIWAGKPVNYAAKAAQQAGRNDLIVTASVWLAIESNDYLTVSCGHNGTVAETEVKPLWEDVEIQKLTHDPDEAAGRILRATWCAVCGEAFMAAVLAGETDRPETDGVMEAVADVTKAQTFDRRRDQIAHKRGMRRVRKRRR